MQPLSSKARIFSIHNGQRHVYLTSLTVAKYWGERIAEFAAWSTGEWVNVYEHKIAPVSPRDNMVDMLNGDNSWRRELQLIGKWPANGTKEPSDEDEGYLRNIGFTTISEGS